MQTGTVESYVSQPVWQRKNTSLYNNGAFSSRHSFRVHIIQMAILFISRMNQAIQQHKEANNNIFSKPYSLQPHPIFISTCETLLETNSFHKILLYPLFLGIWRNGCLKPVSHIDFLFQIQLTLYIGGW